MSGTNLTVLDEVLYLDLHDEISEPTLQRLADCIREIGPSIDQASWLYGDGTVMAALIVVSVNMAIHHGEPALIADALRRNAEMLDVEAQVGTCAGSA